MLVTCQSGWWRRRTSPAFGDFPHLEIEADTFLKLTFSQHHWLVFTGHCHPNYQNNHTSENASTPYPRDTRTSKSLSNKFDHFLRPLIYMTSPSKELSSSREKKKKKRYKRKEKTYLHGGFSFSFFSRPREALLIDSLSRSGRPPDWSGQTLAVQQRRDGREQSEVHQGEE